jgi:aryl-alcohol dehydrogenase-like predicted oxidoreductase
MQKRALGNRNLHTDLEVSVLGLGCKGMRHLKEELILSCDEQRSKTRATSSQPSHDR